MFWIAAVVAVSLGLFALLAVAIWADAQVRAIHAKLEDENAGLRTENMALKFQLEIIETRAEAIGHELDAFRAHALGGGPMVVSAPRLKQ